MTCPLDPRGLSLKPRFDSPSKSSPNRDSDSTLGGVCGIDSRYMKRAALYARVSGDLQAKEGTPLTIYDHRDKDDKKYKPHNQTTLALSQSGRTIAFPCVR